MAPLSLPIFMDCHSTTPVDPRVVEAMLPFFVSTFGNAGSVNHCFGWDAADAVDTARKSIAAAIGANAREIVFTSGATESNNLAIRGIAEWKRRRGDHIVSVATEHKAVLDPLERLSRRGFRITLLRVKQAPDDEAGRIDPQHLDDAIGDDTALVSVMLANNEMGAIHPIQEIGEICRARGVLLHCDATQAVGKIPVDVHTMKIDMMSFSAHKMYGPKGVGALFARRGAGGVRLEPQIHGGGQENGWRAGTLNIPGIVALAKALELSIAEMSSESETLRQLRNQLAGGLMASIPGLTLNGPLLDRPSWRLASNLNLTFERIDGEALIMSVKEIAVSSGSACTSANPEPSHVLRAMGLSDEQTRGSLRFGLGRFNTSEQVVFAIERFSEAVGRLRRMSGIVGN